MTPKERNRRWPYIRSQLKKEFEAMGIHISTERIANRLFMNVCEALSERDADLAKHYDNALDWYERLIGERDGNSNAKS